MSNYKLANQTKLRFYTSRGTLSTEQLWDLPIVELDSLAVELEQLLEESKTKSFLVKKSEEDKVSKLRFDIAYDILISRVEEIEASKTKKEIKEHNQKILGLIAQKEEASLVNKTVEELQAMLK